MDPLSRPEMTTISHRQVMFKELNEGKLPNQLKIFSGRSNGGGSEVKIRAMEKTGTLNESNNAFLEYLTTDYSHEILAKKQNKNKFRDWKHLLQQCKQAGEHL